MSEVQLDCRNWQCPQPVVQLKRLLEGSSPPRIRITVDNEPAYENVTRFLAAYGYVTEFTHDSGLWIISALKDDSQHPQQDANQRPQSSATRPGAMKTLVMVLSPVVGTGDDVLGQKLMKNFISTLPELGDSLWRLVFLNGGVTLAVKDSPVIDDLRALEASGASILVCGACLEHFGLTSARAVGQTTNMLDIVTSIALAEKVIRI